MSTATATALTQTTTTKTYARTAKEEREFNLQINGDKPLVEVKGTNTYPIKGWLWTLGGKFNSETKTWSVPDHTWHDAQTKADELTKAQQEKASAPKVAKQAAPVKAETKPAVVITPAQVVAASAPAPVPTDRIVFRLNNLLTATQDLAKGVKDEATLQALTLAIDALTLAGQNAVAAATK